MNLSQMKSLIYKRVPTNVTNFPDADMVIELNAANEYYLSLIRGYKDMYLPTAWTTSDLSTGTATPVFDQLFHEMIPLRVIAHRTSDLKNRNVVANELAAMERNFGAFYSTRSLSPFTVTIASPGVFTLQDHGLEAFQEVVLSTTGALPTGLSANTIYYVVPVSDDTFQLSASINSTTAINTTGSQSGTHYISGLRGARITTRQTQYL